MVTTVWIYALNVYRLHVPNSYTTLWILGVDHFNDIMQTWPLLTHVAMVTFYFNTILAVTELAIIITAVLRVKSLCYSLTTAVGFVLQMQFKVDFAQILTTRAVSVVLFSVLSVCLSVCLSVSQCNKSWMIRDIITKFSGHYSMVERADRFKNGHTGGAQVVI